MPHEHDHEHPPAHPEEPTLHGTMPPMATPEERNRALDQAFDYRGDVTMLLDDGRRIEGYVFDRRMDGSDRLVRVIPSDGSPRLSVRYAEIQALAFTGRDTAAGKSWATWIKNYHEKKSRGERTDLHPEPLEEK